MEHAESFLPTWRERDAPTRAQQAPPLPPTHLQPLDLCKVGGAEQVHARGQRLRHLRATSSEGRREGAVEGPADEQSSRQLPHSMH